MAIWLSRSRKIAHFLNPKIAYFLQPEDFSYKIHVNYVNSSSFRTLSGENFRSPHAFLDNSATVSALQRRCRRPESTRAGEQVETRYSDDDYEDENQAMDFPGGRVSFTHEMKFISEAADKRIPCYRVLSDDGYLIAGSRFEQVDKETAVKMYKSMVTLQIMDNIFYEAQRQGRISFYLTSTGEEAINIAAAAALTSDDVILPQYREPGILLWRGFTLQEFANQCFGNNADYGKGKQMPIHYGSNKHNFFTISSPIATQLPQAAGVAYSLKMDKKEACVVAFTGDGGTKQFRSDGVVVKGQAYGIRSIRVDGNDALAVYSTIRAAREMVIHEQKPVLVEALSYRVGHHSTSDDSTKYRPVDEIEHWKTARSPLARFRKWVHKNGWWTDDEESELRGSIRKQLLNAIQVAEKTEKPQLAEMFSDVYDNLPSNLHEQEKSLRETIKRHRQDYPTDVPL
ncbi:unnamed protein product [Fraxinus pennsylvanica]|uniref:Dehydrogenase E1 component domain-containing protein n=1 Tax=Fraxinus pennsylvanica TaxID=56036 RepID=A0AAD1YT82_9LAMI|nr:unnamed protein product [Fraxinus pennsylvanica]